MKVTAFLLICLFLSGYAWGDASIIYEIRDANGKESHTRITISGEMARIDESGDESTALIFQAGHLFPLYRVDLSNKRYQAMTPDYDFYLKIDEDRKINTTLFKYPSIRLKPTSKQLVVSGIKCRIVHELVNDEPFIEHCLANSARTGLLDREMRTLIRSYTILKKYHDEDWPGAGTIDENYVSVRSRRLDGTKSFRIRSISYDRIDYNFLRIPKEYELISHSE